MYEITKDGFVFLAMGFTGKLAAQFKEAYIKAFNEMENSLRTQPETHSSRVLLSLDGGKVVASQMVPDGAMVFTVDEIPDLIRHGFYFDAQQLVRVITTASIALAKKADYMEKGSKGVSKVA